MRTFEEYCIEVAKENKLGNTLVTGHKKVYFEMAAILFANEIIDECANQAKVYYNSGINTAGDFEEDWSIDKSSIFNVKNQIK